MANILESVGEQIGNLFSKKEGKKSKRTPKHSQKIKATDSRSIDFVSSSRGKAKSAGAKKEAPKAPKIRITKSVYRRGILKKISSIFSALVLVAFVIYLCFAVTILRVVPTSTDLGFVPVKNMTFAGGIVPPGAKVLMNRAEPQGTTIVDRAKQSLLMSSDAVLVEVVAGPFGQINWTPELLTVDGKPTQVTLEERPEEEYLRDEYIVRCVKGACVPGEGMLLPKDHVYGEVISVSSSEGEN